MTQPGKCSTSDAVPRDAPYPAPTSRSLRVLLVEDDPISLSSLKKILSYRRCQVSPAPTVADAVQLLESGATFDVVILDLMLPDGEGTDVLRFMRAKALKACVIVASASSDEGMLERARKQSPDFMLRKPIDLRALVKLMGLEPDRLA